MPPILDQTGSTYNRGDFTTPNAFFWSSLDLSPYAGTDLGSTPYYIELTDAAGKKATGYLGAVGAGETLGSEVITGWTNRVSIPFETFTYSGKDITSAINTTADGLAFSNILGLTVGAVYRLEINITLNSGTAPCFFLSSDILTSDGSYGLTQLSTGLNSYTFVAGANDVYLVIYANAQTMDFSSTNTIKRVTDPPSTAVHIVSSLNGTTRSWTSIEGGFDPNTIASWGIYDSSALLSPSISPSVSPSISPSASPSGMPTAGAAFVIFQRRRR